MKKAVIIEGMSMPQSCLRCPVYKYEEESCLLTKEYIYESDLKEGVPTWCPMKPYTEE